MVAASRAETNPRLLPRRGFRRPPLLAVPRRTLWPRDHGGALVRARPVCVSESEMSLVRWKDSPPPCGEGRGWGSGGEARASTTYTSLPTPHPALPRQACTRARASAARVGGGKRSIGHHRAVAILERTESFFGRDGGAQLVKVAGIFRFFRRLNLKQIGRVDFAAVGADIAFAEQRIVGWDVLHLGDHGLAIRGAFEGCDRLEIMQGRSVAAGLVHVGEFARPLGLPALGPGAGAVVHVPIEGLGENEALGDLQAERLHVGDVE